MKLLFAIFIIVLLCSCKSKETEMQAIKEIRFHVNPIQYRNTGLFYDYQEKQTIIYFVDIVTDKKIKYFDLSGNLVDTTSLINAHNKIGDISGISVLSKDTVIINSLYTNQILAINKNGIIWHEIDLNKKLFNNKGDYFELYGPTAIDRKCNSVYYKLGWNIDKSKTHKLPNKTDIVTYYWRAKYEGKPFFLRIDSVFSDNYKLNFDKTNLIKESIKSFNNKCYTSFPYFSFVNNKLIRSTGYNNKLYIIDKDEITLDTKVEINSNFTDIGIIPFSITTLKKENVHPSFMAEYGYIYRILFNKVINKYVLIINIENSKTAKDNLETDIRENPFSVMILNENFEKESEFVFDDYKYIGYSSFLTEDGLLIRKNLKTRNNEAIYTLFDIP